MSKGEPTSWLSGAAARTSRGAEGYRVAEQPNAYTLWVTAVGKTNGGTEQAQAGGRRIVTITDFERMEPRALSGMTALLAHCSNLAFLDTSRCYNLQVLNLCDCPVASLATEWLGRLYILNIARTKITELNTRPLAYLQELCAAQTKIRSVDTSALKRLNILLASSTCITALPTYSLGMLRKLHINDCRVAELNVANFGALESLYVENTGISQLDTRWLGGVKELGIAGSNVTYIDLRWMPRISILYASGTNKWLDAALCAELAEISVHSPGMRRLSLAHASKLQSFQTSGSGISYCDLRGGRFMSYVEECKAYLIAFDREAEEETWLGEEEA